MNHEEIRKASQKLEAAREVYQKAAKELLTAVDATAAELERAYEIIDYDYEKMGGEVPHECLSFDENVAYTILMEVRDKVLEPKG